MSERKKRMTQASSRCLAAARVLAVTLWTCLQRMGCMLEGEVGVAKERLILVACSPHPVFLLVQ